MAINIDNWLNSNTPTFQRLTNTVVTITENLLSTHRIDYLTVNGRTKTIDNIKEKIKRKGYSDPIKQLTDISGIRIIVYFETDVARVSTLIKNCFAVDTKNSLDKIAQLRTDQIGYRSVHFVCDLGSNRTILPEFRMYENMKFEFQVRTVLQHAWAELAHDRNYKFTGKLPKEIERELYLYAGMLEIADKGFDQLAKSIDDYTSNLQMQSNEALGNEEINSINLDKFVDSWAKNNNFNLEEVHSKDYYEELIRELNEFGVHNFIQLQNIIPKEFVEKSSTINYSTNTYGLIRDWMLINNFRKFKKDVKFHWELVPTEIVIYSEFLNEDDVNELRREFQNLDYDFE